MKKSMSHELFLKKSVHSVARGQTKRKVQMNSEDIPTKYTQPKKYSYTHLFVFLNYLESYLTYMSGIFLTAIQFPVH